MTLVMCSYFVQMDPRLDPDQELDFRSFLHVIQLNALVSCHVAELFVQGSSDLLQNECNAFFILNAACRIFCIVSLSGLFLEPNNTVVISNQGIEHTLRGGLCILGINTINNPWVYTV